MIKRIDSGFSIVEILVVLGIISFVTLLMSTMVTEMFKQQTHVQVSATAHSIVGILKSNVMTARAWRNSIDHEENTSLTCLRNPPYDCNSNRQGGAFSIFDLSGSLVYKGTNSSSGYSYNGEPCADYKPSGNDACPFRVDSTWAPICSSAGNCLNPQVRVSLRINYSPSSSFRRVPFNPTNYSFEGVRDSGGLIMMDGGSKSLVCYTKTVRNLPAYSPTSVQSVELGCNGPDGDGITKPFRPNEFMLTANCYSSGGLWENRSGDNEVICYTIDNTHFVNQIPSSRLIMRCCELID